MGSRSKRQFVPAEFVVPCDLVTTNFTLRMLSIDKEFGFTAGMLKGSLAEVRSKK